MITLIRVNDGAMIPYSNLVVNGFGENKTLAPFVSSKSVAINNSYDGKFVLGDAPIDCYGYFNSSASDLIPYDPNTEYILSYWSRLNKNLSSGNAYFALFPYDIDKNLIRCIMTPALNNYTYKLAKDVEAGDEYIYFEDLTNWSTVKYAWYIAAYNYTDSTGYTYPVGTYTRNVIDYKTQSNVDKANNRIKLASPYSGATIPKSTPVMQHTDRSTYPYYGQMGACTSHEWKHWTNLSIKQTDDVTLKVTKYLRLGFANNVADFAGVSLMPKGAKGEDGKSPTVSVSKSGTVTTIVVTNADGSKTTQTVNDGTNGTPGKPGADGKTPYFHVKYSNDGGKTFTGNGGETVGTYIGTCTDFNSADPTAVGAYTWAKIKGDTGTGVSAIVEQYYLSTSNSSQTGGSWSTTCPAWQSGHYIWTRSQITWTNGATTYTAPVLAQAINSANQAADTALSSANGKGKSYYQAAQPSSGKDGDLWFELDSSGNAIGIYKYSGKAWVAMPIENDVIASLEAAKITSGSFTGKEFTGGSFTGSRFIGSDFVFADDSPDKGLKGSDGYNKVAFYQYQELNGVPKGIGTISGGNPITVHKKLLLSPVKTNEDFSPEMRCVLAMDEEGNVIYMNKSGAYSFGYSVDFNGFRFRNKNGLGTGINSIAIGSEKEHTISFGWTGSRLRPIVDGNAVRTPVCDPLFDNKYNGMSSSVSLNASISGYDALDVFCKTDDGTQVYTKVCDPTVGTTFEVSVNHIAAGGGNMWIKTKQFSIDSSTHISTARSGSSYFTGNVRIPSNSTPDTVSQSDNITIIKVVGWKY